MDRKNKWFENISLIFILVQVTLTILIYVADKKSLFDTTWIKYVGIILCFLLSCLSFKFKRSLFLIIGLAGTLVADLFLLVLNSYYLVGVIVFIFVQTMYFFYIMPKKWKPSLIIRCLLFLIAVIIFLIIKVTDVTAFFAAFYFINLVMNTFDSYISGGIKLLLFSIGLTLFIGCDISVGFFNIFSYINFSSPIIDKVVDFSQLGMWLFYLPSQTLIALSPFFRKKYE